MNVTRNQQHYIIMTVIYDELVDFYHGGGNVFRDARELISEISGCSFEEVDDYIKNTITYALNKYGEIKAHLEPNLNNWKWERIPILSQAILLMSCAHYFYVEKVDKVVVIDVAVRLAKKYVDEKQAKFINALLDGVLK